MARSGSSGCMPRRASTSAGLEPWPTTSEGSPYSRATLPRSTRTKSAGRGSGSRSGRSMIFTAWLPLAYLGARPRRRGFSFRRGALDRRRSGFIGLAPRDGPLASRYSAAAVRSRRRVGGGFSSVDSEAAPGCAKRPVGALDGAGGRRADRDGGPSRGRRSPARCRDRDGVLAGGRAARSGARRGRGVASARAIPPPRCSSLKSETDAAWVRRGDARPRSRAGGSRPLRDEGGVERAVPRGAAPGVAARGPRADRSRARRNRTLSARARGARRARAGRSGRRL